MVRILLQRMGEIVQFADGFADHLAQLFCVAGLLRALGFEFPGKDRRFQ